MPQLLGVDVSSYQPPNLPWLTWRASGVRFAYIRGGIGYVGDHGAQRHRQEARAAGMLSGSYWVILDHDSETAHFDPVLSARNFDRMIEPGDELPPMVDVEALGVTAPLLSAFLNEFDRLRPNSGVGIYTSQHFWQMLIGNDHYEFAGRPLWVAQYGINGQQDPPRLPDIWQSYVCWQWRYKKGYLPGYDKDLDINLWSGEIPMPATNDQLQGLLNEATAINTTSAKMITDITAAIAAPPPPPPPPPAVLFRVKVLVPVLNVRSGPASTYADIGDAVKDAVLPVYEVAQPSGWYRIDPTAQKWISGGAGYTVRV